MSRTPTIVAGVLLLMAGSVGGYLLGRGRAPAAHGAAPPLAPAVVDGAAAEKAVWTCSMHPQVRLPAPGSCPICSMPLILAASGGPTGAGGSEGAENTLQLSDHAMAMASVETTVIDRRPLTRQLRAVGRIEYNEASLATITPRVDGYAERLFVNVTGVDIRKGDHLAEVYSPELLVAQQELLILLRGGADDGLAEVARKRLRLLGLTDEQVADLVERRRTADHVTLYSPISGTVIEKGVVENAAFKAGEALFRIANLDTVWVTLEVYEFDLPWVRYGQRVRLTAEALPGREFEGLVTFVQPVLDEASRTIQVPVHVENADHALMPGMFVTALLESALTADGLAAPTGAEGRYTCRMHPQVLQDEPGDCPICGMALQQVPAGSGSVLTTGASEETVYGCPMRCEGDKVYPEPGRCPVCHMRLKPSTRLKLSQDVLALPAAAILDSGTRQLVYIERSRGLFQAREVVLGPRAGDYYAVLKGLSPGDRVVTRGNFLIDSQLQVTGKPSLFYPGGLQASSPHAHGAAENGAGAVPVPAPDMPAPAPAGPPPGAHQH